MHLEHWFPTPIWNSTIEFDRISVLEECYRIKTANPQGRKISNRGGWQSDELTIENNQIFEQLYSGIQSKCSEVYKSIDTDFKGRIDTLWININKPSDYNAAHCHPFGALSGVVYIDLSDISGKIRFSNPSIRQHYPIDGYDSPLFFMYTDFKPENHKILIFPSWISHEVFPSPDSDEDRVSLSFNITQIKI